MERFFLHSPLFVEEASILFYSWWWNLIQLPLGCSKFSSKNKSWHCFPSRGSGYYGKFDEPTMKDGDLELIFHVKERSEIYSKWALYILNYFYPKSGNKRLQREVGSTAINAMTKSFTCPLQWYKIQMIDRNVFMILSRSEIWQE